MTCKDCIHYSLCDYCDYDEICHYSPDNIKSAINCSLFHDRSRFVELPYPLKVGDVVFFILENLDNDVFDNGDYLFRIGNCAVASGDMVTEVGTSGFWYRGLYHDGRTTTFVPDSDDFVRWEDVGKDVFLTREEAEQALKERDTK